MTLEESPPHQITERLRENLESMHNAVHLLMSVLRYKNRQASKNFNESLNKYGVKMEEGEIYRISPEHVRDIAELKRKLSLSKKSIELLPRTILVSFISIYDTFLFELIKEFIKIQPNALNCENKQIVFSEILKYPSIQEAKDRILEQEIELSLRESHAKQIQWISKIFNIEIRKFLTCWPQFIEVTERRNLYVHADGIINSQYIQICKEHGVDVSNLKIGETLEVNENYLKQALDCLLEVGIVSVQAIWRKIDPSNLNLCDTSLIRITYHLINQKEYHIAKSLLTTTQTHKTKFFSENHRLIMLINLAQIYYHLEENTECLNIINNEDWSASDLKFKLCVEVLKEDYEEAVKYMKKMGNNGDMDSIDYIQWPIFTKFRLNPKFKTAYKEIFGKEPVSHETLDTLNSESPAEISIPSQLASLFMK